MEVQVAVAKVSKYASRESGDTVEMIERPHGGLSFVLVDGQRSGKGAKNISNIVARKAIALLAEGVRDGAAARAAHDYLFTHRQGKVSATLNIVSLDLTTKTIVLSRNSHCPVVIQHAGGKQTLLDDETQPIGVQRMTRPEITELPIEKGLLLVVFTDGILNAGQRRSLRLDPAQLVAELWAEYQHGPDIAQPLADGMLTRALELDENRASDDVSVLVLAVTPEETDETRRLYVKVPIPPVLRP